MMGLDLEELKKLSKKDEIVGEYMEEIEKVNKNPEFIEFMSAEEDARKIRNSQINEARRTGLAKGLKQGIEKGIKQGIKQGIEQGKTEETKMIAKKMLEKGIDKKEIIEITGLSKEELELLS